MPFNIPLDLSRHCLETEIKRIHNRAVSAYFNSINGKESIEQTIELTRYALESIDFGKMRAQYPPLAGNTDLPAALAIDSDIVTILLDGRPIVPIAR